MKIDYLRKALKSLEDAPAEVRKAFFKQVAYLEIRPSPSIICAAKKYDESKDRWQARVNRDWRFYFSIAGDTYVIRDIVPHPK